MRVFKQFLIISGLLIAALHVHAQSSDELKRLRNKYNEELEQLNREYEETANNKKSSLRQLSLLKEQINIREEKINSINSEVRLLDNQISENNTSIHNLQSQLDLLKKQYAAMILFAYHNRSSYNKLMFVFAAKDFNQGYKRLKYLQEFAGYRERQAQYIESTEKDLHVKINQLDNTKKEKNNILADQIKEKVTLGKQKKDEARVVSDLSKQQGQLKQQQRDLQRKITKTNQEIRDAIRKEIAEARRKAEEAARAAAAANPSGNKNVTSNKEKPGRPTDSEVLNTTKEAAKLSSDFLDNRGKLPWPVTNGMIIRGMGVYTIEGIRTESDGLEIKTNAGAPIRTVFDGKVQAVENVYGTYTVIVIHGEYFTAYSNLKSVTVSTGQKLSTKQMIGTVATDPATGESVVQFAIYKGINPVNPKIWLYPE
ncbi:murein hydrolase activator EnvC family protein [Mucilaginibacter sp.]|jgi:septal ring factor EnvC (AmiA/AmiB activator)|uniref:murein hydrolase activator EnvC family protein n=1 Tax=Mucilaginibacter sp. TaxID=1882438 RepID=UPI002D00F87F|nr:peptidoglycan DD-metalloendopeptidase family protein [Mucilaginibacter sp.]HTI59672.1 peptidoglycan DD-metalloendopeptidase family protein [Mucilaginibacter sp.]